MLRSLCMFMGVLFFMVGCGGGSGGEVEVVKSKKAGDNTVTLHELADPDMLSPIPSSSANATYIQLNIFQQLLGINFETLQLEGVLAKDRPKVEEVTEGEFKDGMKITYEIRPEAVWDNGSPVTADDYIFTIKTIKNPKVNGGSIRPYIEPIGHIEKDAGNPKKFSIFYKEKYILAEIFSGWFVYPAYAYDPKGLMSKFTIRELSDPKNNKRLVGDKNINDFANEFNSPKHAREKEYITGSGPYKFVEWETGQQIILERKKDWWGDKVNLPQLAANPERIVYKVMNDWTTAVTSMKDEGLDVARGIRAGDFVDLRENKRFTQLYNLHSPVALSYDYIGLNTKNPKLSDKRVRRALAHLVDKNEIIDVLLHGLGAPVVGPIHPTKDYYNKSLKNIDYNPEKAIALLEKAGWTDTDGNGIRDKVIDGEKVEMKLEYKYNSGNDRRKNTGLFLQENAKRAGIEISVVAREWTVFLEDTKRRDYEMFCAGWVQSPIPDDLKQLWHTESDTPDGDNRCGFGNEESDRLIEQIQVTLDEDERRPLYQRFQELVYEEQPYIFLTSPKERIAIHSRFDNAKPSLNRPGYNEKAFQLIPIKVMAEH